VRGVASDVFVGTTVASRGQSRANLPKRAAAIVSAEAGGLDGVYPSGDSTWIRKAKEVS
jgi:hypothetical protein